MWFFELLSPSPVLAFSLLARISLLEHQTRLANRHLEKGNGSLELEDFKLLSFFFALIYCHSKFGPPAIRGWPDIKIVSWSSASCAQLARTQTAESLAFSPAELALQSQASL